MRALMVKYTLLIVTYLKAYSKHPLEVFLKLIYLPVQMMMYYFLWINIGKSNTLDITYMITYYLTISLLIHSYPSRHIALSVEQDVMEGTITNCLVRPYSYIIPAFSKYIAWALIYFIIFIPSLVFITFYKGITLAQILYFIVATIVGKFVEFMLWFDIGLIALFIERIKGVIISANAIMLFMSGSLIPLSFFPKWLINITYFFPFRTFIYFPADILLSERSTQYFILNIVIGLFWLILLTIISKLLFNKGVTQLQGNLS
jgi:ABC-2 type transport system permease protein